MILANTARISLDATISCDPSLTRQLLADDEYSRSTSLRASPSMSTCYAVSRILDVYPELSPEEVGIHLHYSSFVNIKRGYLYFEVPKAGCTLLKTLIHRLEKLPPIDFLNSEFPEVRRDMFIHERSNFKMPSIMEFDNIIQRELLENSDFFSFTVVRNPYMRLESVWRDKVRLCAPGFEYLYSQIKGSLPNGKNEESLISFREFVTYLSADDLNRCDNHWRRQTSHLYYKALNFSYVGHLEKLHETLTTFVDHAKYPEPIAVERMNESLGAAHYDESVADLVYALYQDDFLAFGYEKDSWKTERPGHESQVPGTVAESKLIDEIIERNIIMGTLYTTRHKLNRNLIDVSQAYTGLLSAHVQLQKAYQELRESYEKLLASPTAAE